MIATSKRQRRASYARAVHMEPMEPRVLLTAVIEHAADLVPVSLAIAPDSTVWVGTADGHDLNHYTASGTLIHSYDVGAGNYVADIAVAPSGDVWFTELGTSLLHLNVSSGIIDTVSTPAVLEINHIAIGANGTVWYTDVGDTSTDTNEYFDPNIGSVNPSTLVAGPLVNLGHGNTDPTAIKLSGDNIWVSLEGNSDALGTLGDSAFVHVSASTGVVTSYVSPILGSSMSDILPVADGSVWLTLDTNSNAPSPTPEAIYHVTFPGGNPDFSQSIQLDGATQHYPVGLTAASNGKIYLSLPTDQTIASIDPSASTLSLTTAATTTGLPGYLAMGPSSTGTPGGGLWFTERDANLFGVYDLPVVTQQPVVATGVAQISQVQNVAIPTTRLATFTGPGVLADYSATVNWGDGSPTVAGTIHALPGGGYEVVAGGKVFPNEGTLTVTVTINNNTLGETGTATSALKITDTPLTKTSFAVTPLLLRITLLTATFTDDLTANISDFKVTINWGDGIVDSGVTVKVSAGHFAVVDLHQFKKKGTYTVTLEVDPLNGISDANSPIVSQIKVTV